MKVLDSAVEVRRIITHRTRINADKMERLLMDGEALAMGLKVEEYGRAIGRLRGEVKAAVSILASGERRLRDRAEIQLKALAAEKAKIVRQEGEVKARLEAGLTLFQSLAKVRVVKAVREAAGARLDIEVEVDVDMDADGKDVDSEGSGVEVVFA